MEKTTPLVTREEARRVRGRVAETGEKALELLALELAEFRRQRAAPGETWCKKFKIVADQIRRDYRLDGERAEEPPVIEETADPLGRLKLVKKEAG